MSVCLEEFEVSLDDVVSSSRRQELVYCRKAFCIIVKELYDVKYEVIGMELNKSMAAVSKYLANQPDNKYYMHCLNRIRIKINEYKIN